MKDLLHEREDDSPVHVKSFKTMESIKNSWASAKKERREENDVFFTNETDSFC